MNFDLTDDQKQMRETALSFAKKRSPVSRMRKLRELPQPFEAEVWREMGQLGWLGVAMPEDAGGLGGSFFDLAILLEALATTLVPEPLFASVVLGGSAIALAGNAEQRARFLGPMIEGETMLALAHAERGNRYGLDVATTAEPAAGGYRLRGEKLFVPYGQHARHIVVSAKTADGVGLFVVDGNADGVTEHTVQTIDSRPAAHLKLESVQVGADRRLGEGDAREVLERVLDRGAAALVAEGVGVCQTVLEMTSQYLKTREQFGVKIGTFQALQHRAVDMFVECELLRSIALLACAQVDGSDDAERPVAVSAAKAQLAVSGRFVTQQAIQLHGGIGVTDEHDVGLYFKRMQALLSQCGDESHHLERYANLAQEARPERELRASAD